MFRRCGDEMILDISLERQSEVFDTSFTEHSQTTASNFNETSQLISSELSGSDELFDSELNEDVKYFNSEFGEVYEVNKPSSDSGFVTEDDVVEMLNGLKTAKIGWVTLLADSWIGENNIYRQVVKIEGVTENSQVDLTPDVQQLAIFYEKDLSFVTENDGGTVTVYAIGQKPTNDYTIQVTITEVDI